MKKVFLLSRSLELLKLVIRHAPPDWNLQPCSSFSQFYSIVQSKAAVYILIDVSLPEKFHSQVKNLIDDHHDLPFYYVSDSDSEELFFPLIRIPQDLPLLANFLSTEKKSTAAQKNPLDLLQGNSKAACRLREELAAAAKTNLPVLLSGESGTGKTLAAHIIHDLSDRSHAAFFAVNVAAVPAHLADAELFGNMAGAFTDAGNRNGYFSASRGSSLFLDEISELEPGLQAKLLRVIESGRYRHLGSDDELETDARMIFATNKDLSQLVLKKSFRQDLYYRIAKLVIHLPSLAQRVEDIPAISHAFLAERHRRITSSALRLLCALNWKGNIRQLYNCLERASLLCKNGIIEPDDIDRAGRSS